MSIMHYNYKQCFNAGMYFNINYKPFLKLRSFICLPHAWDDAHISNEKVVFKYSGYHWLQYAWDANRQ